MQRCAWADSSPAMQAYHDNEWGRPQHNQQRLFELLCLETYQAGLSWQTVLNKRAAFNEDFADYDVDQVAAMTTADVEQLLTDARIIRHRQKLMATINNARVIRDWPAGEDFATWLWAFVDNQPIRQAWASIDEVPATNDLAQQVSKEMKRRGFKFVGPTTIYSYLQATGLINDHVVDCPFAPENLPA
ncbi:DNA-3-methyladenine glycosylase I [Lactiplantibacillus plantarum]|uniref:DNA-3-methyladenine glycosylase I n=1 Tax=Lactiplantibacillus plantarum TaxID=1590 RepID=UPI0004DCB925|nr:DNA-3-methyladenine glycosylase I [Lactiplantibacillus plantarum]KEZ16192.1 3-methyladenine DNA glycosylase [Lactiplantibacillus plantarum]MBG1238473.1 DNA-3-methyladenine glycosylase I [Lactiplantibacillus plantarum subsp. plantarum]MCL3857162.1 DNA-3-methyladenine glycosylase I [Lactiplantibacillus plantarum]MDV3524821.1 DNA-3-methyladenine glycosylase I [Lactiplantibacillus plantarum]